MAMSAQATPTGKIPAMVIQIVRTIQHERQCIEKYAMNASARFKDCE